MRIPLLIRSLYRLKWRKQAIKTEAHKANIIQFIKDNGESKVSDIASAIGLKNDRTRVLLLIQIHDYLQLSLLSSMDIIEPQFLQSSHSYSSLSRFQLPHATPSLCIANSFQVILSSAGSKRVCADPPPILFVMYFPVLSKTNSTHP